MLGVSVSAVNTLHTLESEQYFNFDTTAYKLQGLVEVT